MKASELRDLTISELNQKLEGKKKELMQLRFQLAINQLDNTNKYSVVKKDIARIKTIMTERQLEIKR